ncbi:MAG: sulfur carrier protein ThiS [Nevskiaceae bacterium]|jgi:sulfur carrier protein|nr:MAG: sulfur carrier protein ThiS [Nevskiaceae bacterium]TAM27414.1 MAG: sulfur carrier protein ThiS [Nevskiaceae bacterium]
MPLLTVNGRPEPLPAPATLAGLIEALQLQGQRLAVEHNGQIVPRSLWSETRLAEQDHIEIVKAIGGG